MIPGDPVLRTILDALPMMFFLKDTENRILLTNQAVADTLGVRPEEMEGTHTSRWYPDEAERYHADDLEVMRSRRPKFGIVEPLRVSGPEKHWIRTDKHPCFGPNGEVTGILVFIRDATQEALAEAERRQYEERTRHAQRLESLGILAGGVAHDFNNLLTGIFGYCDLVQNALPPGSSAHSDLMEIREAARRAAGICNQMLAYSGRGRFTPRPLDLSEVARSVAQLLKSSISPRAAVRLELESSLPAVEAEPAQIQQVVMNLLLNASEAIDRPHGTIAVRTGEIDCDRETLASTWVDDGLPAGRYVSIEVEDDGAGMPPDVLERIFDPFFTTKFAGRGLGLATVLGIVRGHRGAIRIRSAVGRGTTFQVFFPASALPVAPEAVAAPLPEAVRGRGLVLVVDDEPVVRKFARECLERSGFEVVTAADGASALQLVRELGASVVAALLDLTMPGQDGHELLAEIRRLRPVLPAVLSSGYDERDAVGEPGGRELFFIRKPYEPEALVRRIDGAIRSAAAGALD